MISYDISEMEQFQLHWMLENLRDGFSGQN